jgi:Ataxin-3
MDLRRRIVLRTLLISAGPVGLGGGILISHAAAAMYIYHEKQVSSLCGQHCINNLLQMPAFTAFDLADIAHELDAKERKFMLEQGSTTPEALKFLAEDSGNVDEAGNFSLQVLSEALTRSQGLRLVSAGSEDVKGKLSTTGYDQEPGFVCNRHSHWLTIRNINGKLSCPLLLAKYAVSFVLQLYTN